MRYDGLERDGSNARGSNEKELAVAVNDRSNWKVALGYTRGSPDRRGPSNDPNVFQARLQLYWWPVPRGTSNAAERHPRKTDKPIPILKDP